MTKKSLVRRVAGDEVRLVSELTGDTYTNSVGNSVAVVRIENNVLMTLPFRFSGSKK